MSTEYFAVSSHTYGWYSGAANDPEDLWDFGTVRHPATVGRAKQSSITVSGPPLTWENNGTTRSDGSSSSGHHSFNHNEREPETLYSTESNSSKGDLPPLPATPKKFDAQGTVRQANNKLSKELSDEYDDDFEDQDLDVQNRRPQGEDDLPDTTMLDSVVLPAIASVCDRGRYWGSRDLTCPSFSLVYPRKKPGSHSVLYNERSPMPSVLYQGSHWSSLTRSLTLSSM